MSHGRAWEWWAVSDFEFQIYAGLNIFFGMVSIGLLTVVAMDRYLTISCPDVGNGVSCLYQWHHSLCNSHSTHICLKVQTLGFVIRLSLISPEILVPTF